MSGCQLAGFPWSDGFFLTFGLDKEENLTVFAGLVKSVQLM